MIGTNIALRKQKLKTSSTSATCQGAHVPPIIFAQGIILPPLRSILPLFTGSAYATPL